jgi:hypothetical protein
MNQKHIEIAATMVCIILGAVSVLCATPLADEQFSLDDADYYNSFTDFRYNLTSGDRVAFNVSVTGDPIFVGIYNCTETASAVLFQKENVTRLTQEWVAPYNDRFDFYFEAYTDGVSDVHFTLTKLTAADNQGTQGGGLDLRIIGIIAAVVVIVVVVVSLLALRSRKKPSLPIPPPPPPP